MSPKFVKEWLIVGLCAALVAACGSEDEDGGVGTAGASGEGAAAGGEASSGGVGAASGAGGGAGSDSIDCQIDGLDGTTDFAEYDRWTAQQIGQLVDCLAEVIDVADEVSSGSLSAQVTADDAQPAESYVAGFVAAARLRLFRRPWVLIFSARDPAANGGYPNLMLLVADDLGDATSRKAQLWPIYNDANQDVWTAVPVVGTPGSMNVTALDASRIQGSFEFNGSRAGYIPAREIVMVTDGVVDAAIVLDLTN